MVDGNTELIKSILMSVICQHALNKFEAKENQQVEITRSIRTVSIFQALCQSLPPSISGGLLSPRERRGL